MAIIQRLNGDRINLDEIGIRTRDFVVSSPEYLHEFNQIEGQNGVTDNGSTLGPRKIVGSFRAAYNDAVGHALLRDKVFDIFRSLESFYIIDGKQLGKRWLVKVSNSYEVPMKGIYGDFDVEFTAMKGMAESVGTTQDIQKYGIKTNPELWGFGMGLAIAANSLKYTYTAESFQVYNAGNMPIHPFEQELKITLSGPIAKQYTIRNVTTGDRFEIERLPSAPNTTVVLENGAFTIDGVNTLHKTNHGIITLVPGWNIFLTDRPANVAFEFRYYYM